MPLDDWLQSFANTYNEVVHNLVFHTLQLENSADDLAEWFAGTESKLTSTPPQTSDPDDLRHQLQEQKVSSKYCYVFCCLNFAKL